MTNDASAVRAATTGDTDAIRDIAHQTHPQDGVTSDTAAALTFAVFVHPYLRLDPDLAFVVDDGIRPVGYVIGTADTPEFVRRYRTEYLPDVAAHFPAPPARDPSTDEEKLTWLLHNPEWMSLEQVTNYPGHLHINVLPTHARSGVGKTLVTRFIAALRERDVDGVHLATALDAADAQAFFRAVGFRGVDTPGMPASFFVRDTQPV